MMSVVEFGEQLLVTGDLDPIYIMLCGAETAGDISRLRLERWCLAYWMFYHAGVASQLAEAPLAADFWAAAKAHADKPASERGAERRHFRGVAGQTAVRALAELHPDVNSAVRYVTLPTFVGVARRAQTWPLFGPWISFKIADMLERVLRVPVDFKGCNLGVYKDPLKGASIVFSLENELPVKEAFAEFDLITPKERQERLSWALEYHLPNILGHHLAPPHKDRLVNVQEYETVLCKYKSHLNGHYPLGKDTREVRHALHGRGALAERLARHLPAGGAHE